MGGDLSCLSFLDSASPGEAPGIGRTVIAYVGVEGTERSPQDGNHAKARANFWLWGTRGSQIITCPIKRNEATGKVGSVVVGPGFFVALRRDGKLVSWGCDRRGCLGRSRRRLLGCVVPEPICLLPDVNVQVVSVQLGTRHVLALTAPGAVYAWGANHAGQLGVDDTTMRRQPSCLERLRSHAVAQILAVRDMSYALTKSGVVFAWGDNRNGTLGNDAAGAHILRPELMRTMQGTVVTRIEPRDGCNTKHQDEGAIVAYVEGNGKVEERHQDGGKLVMDFWLWGTWGDRRLAAPLRPWVSERLSSGRLHSVVIGHSYFVVLWEDGSLASWGRDSEGCLGLGEGLPVSSSARPIPLPEGCRRIASVQHGRHHLVALSDAGAVYVWGENRFGQLGLGDRDPRYGPTPVEALEQERVVQVLAARNVSFALTAAGTVYTWGDNRDDALALGPQSSGELVMRPAALPGPGSRGGRVDRLELQGLPAPPAR